MCFVLGLSLATLSACGGATSSPDAGAVQTAECLQNATMHYQVELSGSGFEEFGSKKLYGVTEIRLVSAPQASCRNTGSIEIAGSAFDLRMTNLTDEAAYPFIGAFIDMNGDGKCEKSVDLTWGIFGSVAPFPQRLSPANFSTADEIDVCGRFARGDM